ncbi:transcription-repair coupling factor domain protein [Anaplasma phagocytophilum str. CRT53-1]|uniref:Transcription-repair coupling factor domain protein n=1 Tax=Anaplasma phagocytophilum str. CRT53-1 TaxID=1359157 RepID=A0A0F3PUB8_ANAPH|nr:transcription-repair coupling factor domain protein [Anaplasma phagocytophilum str. CRT53-1]KJV85643.1 transcription-repair coupling factor domain protein [Anaplasma phagocytophilum str. CRT53-1]
MYIDFCKECPYVETEALLQAIAANDRSGGKVIDCSYAVMLEEIALRAAFLIVNEDII